jgi:hypothetical protein
MTTMALHRLNQTDAARARTVERIRTRLRELRHALEAMIDPTTYNRRLSAALDAVAELEEITNWRT